MTPFSIGLQVQKVPETDTMTFPSKLVNSSFLCLQLDLDREETERVDSSTTSTAMSGCFFFYEPFFYLPDKNIEELDQFCGL